MATIDPNSRNVNEDTGSDDEAVDLSTFITIHLPPSERNEKWDDAEDGDDL